MPVENILPLPRKKLGDLLHVLVATAREALHFDVSIQFLPSIERRTTTMFWSFGNVFAKRTPSQMACDDSSAMREGLNAKTTVKKDHDVPGIMPSS